MKSLPCQCLHFCMTDHTALARSLGGARRTEQATAPTLGPDACPRVNTRSTFAELAVELGLREVES